MHSLRSTRHNVASGGVAVGNAVSSGGIQTVGDISV
jgi:autotransporter passenger strand-loop-strand repeat protein